MDEMDLMDEWTRRPSDRCISLLKICAARGKVSGFGCGWIALGCKSARPISLAAMEAPESNRENRMTNSL